MAKDNLVLFGQEYDGVEHLIVKDEFGVDRDFIRPNNIMVISENNTYPVADCKQVDVQLPPQTGKKLQIAENGEFTPDTYSGEYYNEVVVQMATELTDEEITITENGTYKPSTGHMFSKVEVDVPCDVMVGYDEWGNPVTPYVDPITGKLEVKKLPDHIKVTVNSTKMNYLPNETIDYSGIEVRAYNKDDTLWTEMGYTNGIIPFNELIFPVKKTRDITISNEYTPDVQPNEYEIDYSKQNVNCDFRRSRMYYSQIDSIMITNEINIKTYSKTGTSDANTTYHKYVSDAAVCCVGYYDKYSADRGWPASPDNYVIMAASYPFCYYHYRRTVYTFSEKEIDHGYLVGYVNEPGAHTYRIYDPNTHEHVDPADVYGPCYYKIIKIGTRGTTASDPIDYPFIQFQSDEIMNESILNLIAWMIAFLGTNGTLNDVVLPEVPKYYATSSLDCGIAQPICYSTTGLIANGCSNYINQVVYYLDGTDVRISLAAKPNNKSYYFVAASSDETAYLTIKKVTTDLRSGEENTEESYIKLTTSYIYDDKKVYFTNGTITTGGNIDYIEPLATNDKVGLFHIHSGQIAWTIVYGEIQESETESESTIETVNIQWKRPKDRNVLETNITLNILLNTSNGDE